MALPRPMGRRIEAAGCSRMKPGMVTEGMYVVILAAMLKDVMIKSTEAHKPLYSVD